MRLAALFLVLMLSACSVHQTVTEEPVSNPWQVRAQSLARSGVDAMGRGQWSLARTMFERSLQAATLAGDERLVTLNLYNIGRANTSSGDTEGARHALQQALRHATDARDGENRRRASLALAMLDADAGRPVGESLLEVPAGDPVDIHLAVASLAARTGRDDRARQAYERVLTMAGQDRAGRLYAARAELGLAELLRTSDRASARSHLHASMQLLQQAGLPRVMLHAMQLAEELAEDEGQRQLWQQRAEALRQAMQQGRDAPSDGG